MCKHEDKYCPRCKQPFECKVGSILLCQCSTVSLNDEERDFINQQYEDCLCASCLKELRAVYHKQKFQRKLKGILGVFYKDSSGS
ncbi:cysteine-rich CWC family protein [Niabella beijingensis]|uniref:cysteine-rich CWC family protein n=1 Tax=Niabella beijingensis TaxID=2872700 RepID=UPI001CBDF156|nr:cysteine-rich CWC family protein [Niabella beijingensis]MBZ4189194.1 cysteine-rich CWC family protein [Niabella beijingensis]